MVDSWRVPAVEPTDYHKVEVREGRKFIVRLNTGADVNLALEKFARDHEIMFARVHCSFQGGFQPARVLFWTPDSKDPEKWDGETAAVVHNLCMGLQMSGVIRPRIYKGEDEPSAAIHFTIGGGWDVPTVGGHLDDGTIVKGVCSMFITELLGIKERIPASYNPESDDSPPVWFIEDNIE